MVSVSSFWIFVAPVVVALLESLNVEAYYIEKRVIAPETNVDNLETANNPLQINFDEYPMVVPKRAAVLLDRMMVALHQAMEEENGKRVRINSELLPRLPQMRVHHVNDALDKARYDIISDDPADLEVKELKGDNRNENVSIEGELLRDSLKTFGENFQLMKKSFQRRGQDDEGSGRNNGRVYWRCYFNAVSCF